jgi:hypothetical protein
VTTTPSQAEARSDSRNDLVSLGLLDETDEFVMAYVTEDGKPRPDSSLTPLIVHCCSTPVT